jgi:hypothetical protein
LDVSGCPRGKNKYKNIISLQHFLGLSIICGGLKWLKDHRNRQALSVENTTKKIKESSEPDWIQEWKVRFKIFIK